MPIIKKGGGFKLGPIEYEGKGGKKTFAVKINYEEELNKEEHQNKTKIQPKYLTEKEKQDP